MTTPPLGQFPAQQAQAARDVNTASLCRIGQETVQDIVLRTMEIFQLLRNMQVSANNEECPEGRDCAGQGFCAHLFCSDLFWVVILMTFSSAEYIHTRTHTCIGASAAYYSIKNIARTNDLT